MPTPLTASPLEDPRSGGKFASSFSALPFVPVPQPRHPARPVAQERTGCPARGSRASHAHLATLGLRLGEVIKKEKVFQPRRSNPTSPPGSLAAAACPSLRSLRGPSARRGGAPRTPKGCEKRNGAEALLQNIGGVARTSEIKTQNLCAPGLCALGCTSKTVLCPHPHSSPRRRLPETPIPDKTGSSF